MEHDFEIKLFVEDEKLCDFTEPTLEVYQSDNILCISFAGKYINSGNHTYIMDNIDWNGIDLNGVHESISGIKKYVNKVAIYSEESNKYFYGYVKDILKQTHDYDDEHDDDECYLLVFDISETSEYVN